MHLGMCPTWPARRPPLRSWTGQPAAGATSTLITSSRATPEGRARRAGRALRRALPPAIPFLAQKNWTNDPNGLVFYKGEYHLFFQHNPDGHQLGQHDLGPRRQPGPGPLDATRHAIHPDKLGTIFSGSAVVDWDNTAGFQTGDEKVIVCIYTSAGGTSPESKGQPFTQSIAYSNDRGRTGPSTRRTRCCRTSSARNRDPKVIWHEPSEEMGHGPVLDGNNYALFASPNLKEWTNSATCRARLRRMPRLLRIARRWRRRTTRVGLLGRQQQLLLGTFDGTTFTQGGRAVPFALGSNYYAAQSTATSPRRTAGGSRSPG